ncbi:MAG TPA: flagellar basal body rod protein FlgC [Rickettsiales bacterium]|nr:flagellar basal body rod protein FlgC [Rickettsiales bacterium]
MGGITDAFFIAGAGMHAQGDRLRVVAENIANVDSTGDTPGAIPYQRRTITFRNVLDEQLGIDKVVTSGYGVDKAPFKKKYEPGNPAADKQGYVLYPNVDSMVELVDMHEAQRDYEADLNVIDVSKSMISQTLGLLK